MSLSLLILLLGITTQSKAKPDNTYIDAQARYDNGRSACVTCWWRPHEPL